MNQQAWLTKLDELLPLFGHRNWIVVTDAAYPAQCSPGVETIAACDPPLDVLRAVWQRVDAAPHIRATVHTDAELAAVPEDDAPGVSAYRQELDEMFAGQPRVCSPHEQIIAKLDEAARRFRILIIKTPMRMPYTSVFFELGCGYWSAEAASRLRKALA